MKWQCVRCGATSKVMTTSYLNTDDICIDCQEEEKEHPLYNQAVEIEMKEVKNGNYNYPGLFAGKAWTAIKLIKTL